jgi:hypothetical protein
VSPCLSTPAAIRDYSPDHVTHDLGIGILVVGGGKGARLHSHAFVLLFLDSVFLALLHMTGNNRNRQKLYDFTTLRLYDSHSSGVSYVTGSYSAYWSTFLIIYEFRTLNAILFFAPHGLLLLDLYFRPKVCGYLTQSSIVATDMLPASRKETPQK